MKNSKKALVLVVDDDVMMRKILKGFLMKEGYRVLLADGADYAERQLEQTRPDLIFLDVMMPGKNGYEFCAELQQSEKHASIPVVFLTSLEGEQDKAKAFSVGAVDYLIKPPKRDDLISAIEKQLGNKKKSDSKQKVSRGSELTKKPPGFSKFKAHLLEVLAPPEAYREKLVRTNASRLYSVGIEVGLSGGQMARMIAAFLELPYRASIDPEEIKLGVMPTTFCKKNLVIPVKKGSKGQAFILSNPFNLEVLDMLERLFDRDSSVHLIITEPENIDLVIKYADSMFYEEDDPINFLGAPISKLEKHPVVQIANTVLSKAVRERASDIHIHMREETTMIRFRVDGDLMKVMNIKKNIGVMLISRFKAIAGLDIAEKRKPQDGALETVLDGKKLKLRLSTTTTPHGESLVIRVLESGVNPKALSELGMTGKQSMILERLASRNQGLILIVGTTGSGKTTTIFSLLSHIDCSNRNLISVEDPVEYRIPDAGQHQVNEKAGVTFEALLKSSVRQDPDILFIGEIRDNHSAKTAIDFSSTGHLTISTLHTANTTSAIFRLERLGVSRSMVADSVIGIVAQKLIKTLCVSCKTIKAIGPEDKEMLAPFMEEVPLRVAYPVGCPKCNDTGYFGRVGIFEVLELDASLFELVRSDMPIADLRSFVREKGGYLISDHAIEKLKNGILTPRDIYEQVLIEDIRLKISGKEKKVLVEQFKARKAKETVPETIRSEEKRILVVEDDNDTRLLICRILEKSGAQITAVDDGVDALMEMAKNRFDLILADLDMPHLDGFQLMEIKKQKGIDSPVIFVTGETSEESEVKGLEMGAVDYIGKPIKKAILLQRVKRVLGMSEIGLKLKAS